MLRSGELKLPEEKRDALEVCQKVIRTYIHSTAYETSADGSRLTCSGLEGSPMHFRLDGGGSRTGWAGSPAHDAWDRVAAVRVLCCGVRYQSREVRTDGSWVPMLPEALSGQCLLGVWGRNPVFP